MVEILAGGYRKIPTKHQSIYNDWSKIKRVNNMSGNLIACIIFLVLGIGMVGFVIYSAYRMIAKDEEYMIIPGILFSMFGLIFIWASAIHWNDDKEYKTIDCSEYYIDTNVKYSKDGQVDTTYTIHYK